MLLMTYGEDGVFDGSSALQAPAVFGDLMSEFLFENADGRKGFGVRLTLFIEGRGLFGVAMCILPDWESIC